MEEAPGTRWGDLSYLLGGYSKKRELLVRWMVARIDLTSRFCPRRYAKAFRRPFPAMENPQGFEKAALVSNRKLDLNPFLGSVKKE